MCYSQSTVLCSLHQQIPMNNYASLHDSLHSRHLLTNQQSHHSFGSIKTFKFNLQISSFKCSYIKYLIYA